MSCAVYHSWLTEWVTMRYTCIPSDVYMHHKSLWFSPIGPGGDHENSARPRWIKRTIHFIAVHMIQIVCIVWCLSAISGIILCMHPAYKKWYNIAMLSLIGWVHTQNGPCGILNQYILFNLNPYHATYHVLWEFQSIPSLWCYSTVRPQHCINIGKLTSGRSDCCDLCHPTQSQTGMPAEGHAMWCVQNSTSQG